MLNENEGKPPADISAPDGRNIWDSTIPSCAQEPVVPEGYSAVEFGENGMVAFKPEPPTIHQLLQVGHEQAAAGVLSEYTPDTFSKMARVAVYMGGAALAVGCIPPIHFLANHHHDIPAPLPRHGSGISPMHLTPAPTPDILRPIPSPIPTKNPIYSPTPKITPTKELSPTAHIAIEKPTATLLETEVVSRLAKYFIPLDQKETILKNGGIVINGMKPEEILKLKFTKPRGYYAECDPGNFRKFLEQYPNQDFAGFFIDPRQPIGKFCTFGFLSKDKIKQSTQSYYPGLDPKSEAFQRLIEKQAQIDQYLRDNLPDEPFLWDLYYKINTGYAGTSQNPYISLVIFKSQPTSGTSNYVEEISMNH